MRSFKNIIFTFTVILITFTFCGCNLIHSHKDPKSITVDGIKYVDGFYDDDELYFKAEYREDSTRLFEKGNHYWWRVDDSAFDIYYCIHKDSLWWHPKAYCREDGFNEVRSYYKNIENYDYYLAVYPEIDITEKKLPEDIDKDKIEKVISLARINDKSAFEMSKYKKIKLDLEGEDYGRFTVYRVSKDGLFTTYRTEWIYYNEGFYQLAKYNGLSGSDGIWEYYVLDYETNGYIISLLKENGFI